MRAVLVLPSQEAWEGQDPSVLLAWLPATRASCAPSPQQKGVGTGCRCQPRAKVCSWHAGARGTWTSRVHLPSPSPPPAPPSAPTHITPPSRKSPSTPLQSSGGRSQGRCFNSKPSCVAEPLPSASARTSPAPYSPGSTGLKLPGRPSAEMALGEPVPAAAPAACSEPRRPRTGAQAPPRRLVRHRRQARRCPTCACPAGGPLASAVHVRRLAGSTASAGGRTSSLARGILGIAVCVRWLPAPSTRGILGVVVCSWKSEVALRVFQW